MRTEIDRWAEINFAKKQGEAKGRAEGRAEGREEGIAEGIAQAARTMKNKGYDPSEISECTGLSEEQIAALK